MFTLLAHGRPRGRYLIGTMKRHQRDNRLRVGFPSTHSDKGSDDSLIVDPGCPCLSTTGVNPTQHFNLPSMRQSSLTYRSRAFVSPGPQLNGIRATAGCLSLERSRRIPTVSAHTWSMPPPQGGASSPCGHPFYHEDNRRYCGHHISACSHGGPSISLYRGSWRIGD